MNIFVQAFFIVAIGITFVTILAIDSVSYYRIAHDIHTLTMEKK